MGQKSIFEDRKAELQYKNSNWAPKEQKLTLKPQIQVSEDKIFFRDPNWAPRCQKFSLQDQNLQKSKPPTFITISNI